VIPESGAPHYADMVNDRATIAVAVALVALTAALVVMALFWW